MLALACSFLAGCLGAGREVTEPLPGTGLQSFKPVDVAVAPILNHSQSTEVPGKALRSALYSGLVERLYSPLDLAFVDKRWSEASFDASNLEVDAILKVVVTDWNRSLWKSRGAIVVTLEARLLHGAKPQGDALWGARLTRRVDLANERVLYPDETVLWKIAAERLAAEVLMLLPERGTAGLTATPGMDDSELEDYESDASEDEGSGLDDL